MADGPIIRLGATPPPAAPSPIPFAPSEAELAQLSAETGQSPDQIRSYLAAQAPAPGPAAPDAPAQPWMVGMGNLAAPAPARDLSGMLPADMQAAQANEQIARGPRRAVSLPPESTTTPGAQPSRRASVAPPGTQGARPGSAGGMPSWRKILGAEMQKREAEAAAAGAQLEQARAGYQDATDKLIGVQQGAINAEADALGTIAQAQDKARARVAELNALDAAKRQQEDEAIALQNEKVTRGYQELQEATIDDRLSPGDNAMATLGVALSGLADAILMSQGKSGQFQKNAIALVDQQIQRKVDKQLEALGRKRENLSARERAVANFVAQVGDKRAARSMLVQKEWEDLAALSEQVKTKSQSDLKRTAATELGALATQQAQAYQLEGSQAAATAAAQRVREIGDFGFEVRLKQAMGAGQKPKQGPAAYGLRQLAEGTPEDAKKAQEIASGMAGIQDTIAKLEEMAARGPTLSPDERATARRRLASLKSQFNGTFGDGTAPNEAQLEALDEMFANPTEVNLGNARKQFGAFRQDASDMANAKMRPYGYALDDVDTRPE